MNRTTTTTLKRIISEQHGYLTQRDARMLYRDPTMSAVRVLVRLYTGRCVVPLWRLRATVEAAGDDVRDVCFPADVHRALARWLAISA